MLKILSSTLGVSRALGLTSLNKMLGASRVKNRKNTHMLKTMPRL